MIKRLFQASIIILWTISFFFLGIKSAESSDQLIDERQIVSVKTWLVPFPVYSKGWMVLYGSQRLVEANADYRGYDLSFYKDRCGLAVMSPADLGKIVWLRDSATKKWYGPCLAVDVGGRADYYRLVYEKGEIAEISKPVADIMKFEYGEKGEMFLGYCPPKDIELVRMTPTQHLPPLAWDIWGEKNPTFWPFPEQQEPINCDLTGVSFFD